MFGTIIIIQTDAECQRSEARVKKKNSKSIMRLFLAMYFNRRQCMAQVTAINKVKWNTDHYFNA